MNDAPSGWGKAWIALSAALAIHVADEAANDFLSVYNHNAEAMRERFPGLPVPTFSFGQWLTGLVIAILLSFALSLLAFRGTRGLRFVAWPYALLMFGNGLSHIAFSVVGNEIVPGALSAPLLLVASVWMMRTTSRMARPSISALLPRA